MPRHATDRPLPSTLLAMLCVACTLAATSPVSAMSCVVESLSDLAFGRYLVTQRKPLDAVAFLVFSCDDVQGGED